MFLVIAAPPRSGVLSADGKCSFIEEHFLSVLAGEKLQDDADTFYCRTYELVKKREERERKRERNRKRDRGKKAREREREGERKIRRLRRLGCRQSRGVKCSKRMLRVTYNPNITIRLQADRIARGFLDGRPPFTKLRASLRYSTITEGNRPRWLVRSFIRSFLRVRPRHRVTRRT